MVSHWQQRIEWICTVYEDRCKLMVWSPRYRSDWKDGTPDLYTSGLPKHWAPAATSTFAVPVVTQLSRICYEQRNNISWDVMKGSQVMFMHVNSHKMSSVYLKAVADDKTHYCLSQGLANFRRSSGAEPNVNKRLWNPWISSTAII